MPEGVFILQIAWKLRKTFLNDYFKHGKNNISLLKKYSDSQKENTRQTLNTGHYLFH